MGRIDRSRRLTLAESIEAASAIAPPPRVTAFVGRVVNLGAMPAGPGRYVMVNPVELSGAESEGGSGTLTANAARTIAVDLLSGTPAVGDYLICEESRGRWVAEKVGPGDPYALPPLCGACYMGDSEHNCFPNFFAIAGKSWYCTAKFAHICNEIAPDNPTQAVVFRPAHVVAGGCTTPLWVTDILPSPPHTNLYYQVGEATGPVGGSCGPDSSSPWAYYRLTLGCGFELQLTGFTDAFGAGATHLAGNPGYSLSVFSCDPLVMTRGFGYGDLSNWSLA